MSTPTPPPTPPVPDTTSSLPPWANPAFFLALIPQLAAVLTLFFHKDFGLTANTTAYALLASAIVGFGAYIARAFKHHQTGTILSAYFNLLASGNVPIPTQFGGDGQTVPALVTSGAGQTSLVVNNVPPPPTNSADNGTDVPPPLPPLDGVSEPPKRRAPAKKTAKKTASLSRTRK